MKGKKILDDTNRFIISELAKDGRVKFTTLARKLKVTPAAVKERIDRLIDKKLIKVSGLINSQKLYPITAVIGIEADAEGVNILVRKLRNCPLIFHMTKVSGMHNLIISMVAEDVQHLEKVLAHHIRNEPGIKHVEVNIGNTPIIPEFCQLKLCYSKPLEACPCGTTCNECMSYLDGSCKGCPVTVFYKE